MNPEPFKPHPNLSDEINRNIAQSEIDGGAHLDQLKPGRALRFVTLSREYILAKDSDSNYTLVGHPKFCPEPTSCTPHGSSWGGSMLKMDFLGRGMRFEASIDNTWGYIRTSRVVLIEEIDAPQEGKE